MYAAGFFCLSTLQMMMVIVPLWALAIGASPFWFGIAVAARNLLPVLLSIHGGAMIDRLGATRVMIITALISAALAFAYPAAPWIWALILLQILSGFTQALTWMGAQAEIGRLTRGDATITGRFTFFSTIGNTAGPLMVGTAWDFGGEWAAFSLMGIWTLGAIVAVALLPRTRQDASEKPKPTIRELTPRLRDYVEAAKLVRVPLVGFLVTGSLVLTCVYGIRHSFYPVYMEGIGLSGTEIGAIISLATLCSSVAGLMTGRATRRFNANALLLTMVAGGTVALMLTPYTGGALWLSILAVCFGLAIGLGFPLLLSGLARAVDSTQQGLTVGLRVTANRIGAMIVPILMGLVAESAGLTASFLITGGAILFATALMWIWMRRLRADK